MAPDRGVERSWGVSLDREDITCIIEFVSFPRRATRASTSCPSAFTIWGFEELIFLLGPVLNRTFVVRHSLLLLLLIICAAPFVPDVRARNSACDQHRRIWASVPLLPEVSREATESNKGDGPPVGRSTWRKHQSLSDSSHCWRRRGGVRRRRPESEVWCVACRVVFLQPLQS
ncbi:hypothetical protein M427DRAFT_354558 [Gonapodya prolifera JEL478]|uniref:Uncharacterized protein n=1 Tax=Gonapodya prolifera (strain JEL478) TaxID=1344416 RepID=A0A139ABH2_GONPJ|nr:hypothetical protein M427DRAFT_354558 [Gonapodya prolifera JEL478]|eukprot:KXS14097.1 hypothetical protein M427DRAFT_354558 [Gonapodya prolifera JEL478]